MISLVADPTSANALVQVTGELTVYHAAEFATDLLTRLETPANLELNLEGVTELDTAGVQVLLLARRQADAQGVVLRLSHASRPVMDVLTSFNLTELLEQPPEQVQS